MCTILTVLFWLARFLTAAITSYAMLLSSPVVGSSKQINSGMFTISTPIDRRQALELASREPSDGLAPDLGVSRVRQAEQVQDLLSSLFFTSELQSAVLRHEVVR